MRKPLDISAKHLMSAASKHRAAAERDVVKSSLRRLNGRCLGGRRLMLRSNRLIALINHQIIKAWPPLLPSGDDTRGRAGRDGGLLCR